MYNIHVYIYIYTRIIHVSLSLSIYIYIHTQIQTGQSQHGSQGGGLGFVAVWLRCICDKTRQTNTPWIDASVI